MVMSELAMLFEKYCFVYWNDQKNKVHNCETYLNTALIDKGITNYIFFEINSTGGPRLVRFLGPGKNRTMQNSY